MIFFKSILLPTLVLILAAAKLSGESFESQKYSGTKSSESFSTYLSEKEKPTVENLE